MLFMPYAHLHRSLLCAQHCCHLLVGTVVNKIKESRHSKEYYPKNGMKSLKRDKIGDKISPGRLISGTVLEHPGRIVTLLFGLKDQSLLMNCAVCARTSTTIHICGQKQVLTFVDTRVLDAP